MKILKIKKTFETAEEVYASSEFHKIWEGFNENKPFIRYKNEFTFYKAFVTAGQYEDDIWMWYKCLDGMVFLRKISVCSCLDNADFRLVLINEEKNEIVLTDMFFKKSVNLSKNLPKLRTTFC
jgi:hypothetical protein